MLSLNDHPAFRVPPSNGACCDCVNEYVECPTVTMESRIGAGAFFAPGPCGFYKAEDGKYYLKKTRVRYIAVRPRDPAPRRYDCEIWYNSSGNPRRVGTIDNSFDVDYNALEELTYTLNDEGACELADPVIDAESYTIRTLIHAFYPLAGPCTDPIDSGVPGDHPPPGANVDEIDPDNSTDETTYDDEWTAMGGEAVKGRAEELMELDFAEQGWVEDGSPASTAYVGTAEDDSVTSAGVSRAEVRWHVQGTSSGYVRIEWEVRDEDGSVVDSGATVQTWDPMVGYDDYLPGPSLGAPPWPEGDVTAMRILTVTGVFCEPGEGEE